MRNWHFHESITIVVFMYLKYTQCIPFGLFITFQSFHLSAFVNYIFGNNFRLPTLNEADLHTKTYGSDSNFRLPFDLGKDIKSSPSSIIS